MKYYTALFLALFMPLAALSFDLTNSLLVGKWRFVRIVAEDYEKPVKITMEFQQDGTVINYAHTGQEFSRGVYQIEGDSIVYTDKNGDQNWVVKSITANSLHVDNRGAEMFFER